MKNRVYILIIGLVFILGCSSTKNSSNKNIAGIYMPGLNLIRPTYKVFHKNDSTTEFHFRLHSENILYTRKRGDSTFSSNILIHYELIDKISEKIVDSTSIHYTDFSDNKTKKYLDGKFEVPTQLGKSYDLLVTFNDLSRDHYLKKHVFINRQNLNNEQNYLIVDSNQNVIFNDYFKKDNQITIIKNENNPNPGLYLKYYSTSLPIAKPPFSEDDLDKNTELKPDAVEELTFDSLNSLNYTISERGLYHFQASKSDKEGPTLFNFQENFPKVMSLENMIEAMRYITTKKEFSFLNESENTKAAVDKFWLDAAGSNERARTLIREYFNRVENANLYFTSYMEGWKTDRGIIYIIYGSPNVVYKGKDYENWIYGEENNVMSVSFVFSKVNNPISNNDYRLNRSPSYKNTWFRAVDSWRNGRIY
ncbi:MAG: GWxTD domain-containing protein [Vicingus serpentipes]|nr:GWxTD domain-containing protein [Vicingus serpentipes]